MSVNGEIELLKQQIEVERLKCESIEVTLKGQIQLVRLENLKLLEENEDYKQIIINFNKNKSI